MDKNEIDGREAALAKGVNFCEILRAATNLHDRERRQCRRSGQANV